MIQPLKGVQANSGKACAEYPIDLAGSRRTPVPLSRLTSHEKEEAVQGDKGGKPRARAIGQFRKPSTSWPARGAGGSRSTLPGDFAAARRAAGLSFGLAGSGGRGRTYSAS